MRRKDRAALSAGLPSARPLNILLLFLIASLVFMWGAAAEGQAPVGRPAEAGPGPKWGQTPPQDDATGAVRPDHCKQEFAISSNCKSGDLQCTDLNSRSPVQSRLEVLDLDEQVVIRIDFSSDQLAGPLSPEFLEPEKLPLSIEPPLPLTGAWIDQRTLELRVDLKPDEYWDRICKTPMVFSWKEGTAGLPKQPGPDSPEELAAKFRRGCPPHSVDVMIFDQIGPIREGQVTYLMLTFGAGVTRAEMDRALKVRILRPTDETLEHHKEVEAKWRIENHLGGPDSKLFSEAKISVSPVRPLDTVIMNFDGLLAADKKTRVTRYMEEVVINDFPLKAAPAFSWDDGYGHTYGVEPEAPWRPYLELDLRAPIFSDSLKDKIKLDPPLEFAASAAGPEGNRLRLMPLKPYQGRLKVSLLPGLATNRGILFKTIEIPFNFPDGRIINPAAEPDSQARFDRALWRDKRGDKGWSNWPPLYVSPPQAASILALGPSRDGQACFQAWRIPDYFRPDLMRLIKESGLAPVRELLRTGRPMPAQLIESADPGKNQGSDKKLADFLGQNKGPYILLPRPKNSSDPKADKGDSKYKPHCGTNLDLAFLNSINKVRNTDFETSRLMSVSDLGLSARTTPEGAAVWVVDLKSGRPLPQAKVQIYNHDYLLSAEGLTNGQGLFMGGPESMEPLFILVEKDADQNFLMLDSSLTPLRVGSPESPGDRKKPELSDRDRLLGLSSAQPYYGLEATADKHEGHNLLQQTESEIPLAANPDLKLDRHFIKPSQWEAFIQLSQKTFSAGERISAQAIIRNSKMDQLPPTTELLWRLTNNEGLLLHQETKTGPKPELFDFPVDESLPPAAYTLSVFLPDDQRPLGQAELFIRPPLSKNTPAQLQVIEMTPPPDSPADYQVFRPQEARRVHTPHFELKRLSANAGGWLWQDVPTPQTGKTAAARPSNQSVSLAKGPGSPPTDNIGLQLATLVPTKPLLGQPVPVQVAGRWNGGRMLGGLKLKMTLYRQTPTFLVGVHDKTGGGAVPARDDLIKLDVFEMELDDSGRAQAEFNPIIAGTYKAVIEGSDPDLSPKKIERWFNVFGSLQPDEEQIESVGLYWDKRNYQPGELARLFINSPFEGPVWLSIETGGATRHLILQPDEWRQTLVLYISADMMPNAWISALALDSAGRRRALGALMLEIDPETYKKTSKNLPEAAAAFFKTPRRTTARYFDSYEPRPTPSEVRRRLLQSPPPDDNPLIWQF